MTQQLKQDLTSSAARIAGDNTVLKCGECLHFKGSPHPAIGQVCQLRGVKTYALAPNCYTPDVHQLKSISTESMAQLSMFVASCKPSQAKILMGMFKVQAQLKRFDLAFLEKVYFAIGTGEFLSDYYGGFVMGVGPQQAILIVGTQYFSNARNPVVAQLDRRSVLTRSEFGKRASRLSARGRLNPPKARQEIYVPPNIADYVPPTIESSQELLESRVADPKKKPVKARSVLEIRMK
jgi:hypothetical protein